MKEMSSRLMDQRSERKLACPQSSPLFLIGESTPPPHTSPIAVSNFDCDEDATNKGEVFGPLFLPVMDSPLHGYTASKTLKMAVSDVISLHSTDAEGEEEDSDDSVIVLPYSPSKHNEVTSCRSTSTSNPVLDTHYPSLFTPPPSDRYAPISQLSTPGPISTKKKKKTKRILMSHVEVPLLQKPKSRYIWMSQVHEKKYTTSTSGVRVHKSSRHALQASVENNKRIGILPNISKKPLPKEKAHSRKETVSKIPGPGPSRRSRESMSARGPSKLVPKIAKRPVDVDLTLSDEDVRTPIAMMEPKVPQYRSSSPCYTLYNPIDDFTFVIINSLVPIEPELLLVNTRSLCPSSSTISLKQNLAQDLTLDAQKPARQSTPWFYQPSSFISTETEITLSDSLHYTFLDDISEDDGFEDEVQILEPISNYSGSPSTIVSSNPPPPRIDLAEHLLKRKSSRRQLPKGQAPIIPSLLSPSTSHDTAASILSTSIWASPNTSQQEDLGHETNFMDKYLLGPAIPSEKSLGKRKAIDPVVDDYYFPPTLSPSFHSSSVMPSSHFRNPENMNVFMNNFNYSPTRAVSDTNMNLSALESPTLAGNQFNGKYDMNRSVDVFISPDGMFTVDTGRLMDPVDSLLHLEGGNTSSYQFDTVDPTLLGGTLTNNDLFTQDIFEAYSEPDLSVIDVDVIESRDQSPALRASSVFSVVPSPPPPSSLFVSSTGVIPLAPQTPLDQGGGQVIGTTSKLLSNTVFVNHKRKRQTSPAGSQITQISRPRRRAAPRHLQDMVSSQDLDVLLNGHDGRRSSNISKYVESTRHTSSSRSEFEEHENKQVRDRSASQPKSIIHVHPQKIAEPLVRAQPSVSQEQMLAVKIPEAGWPTVNLVTYCHQCRNKSNLLKMNCLCGAIFCVRCLTIRYPGRIFNYDEGASENCPRCSKYCNCTSCCQKRGEEYVSSRANTAPRRRTVDLAPRLEKGSTSKSKLSRVVKTHIYRHEVPSLRIPENTRYWGTIYDTEGRTLGKTSVVTAETDSDVPAEPPFVFARVDQIPPLVVDPVRNRKDFNVSDNRRIFVGAVQGAWGFTTRRLKVNDLRPLKKQKPYKMKSYERHSGSARRFFVGSPAFLLHRLDKERDDEQDEQEDENDLLRGLSPLTSLDESDEEQKTQGPEVATFDPNCLTEHDVARAIILALSAIGDTSFLTTNYLPSL